MLVPEEKIHMKTKFSFRKTFLLSTIGYTFKNNQEETENVKSHIV